MTTIEGFVKLGFSPTEAIAAFEAQSGNGAKAKKD